VTTLPDKACTYILRLPKAHPKHGKKSEQMACFEEKKNGTAVLARAVYMT
jgi:hypothetical protein